MTAEQRRLARHALGLNCGDRVYRNHYACTPGTAADGVWRAMCEAGLATVSVAGARPDGLRCYSLTEAGIVRALEPEAAG